MMKNLIFKVLVLLPVALLVACAGVAPKALSSSATLKPIELTQPYEFITKFPGGAVYKNIVIPGVFNAVAEDPEGLYYKGPSFCFSATLLEAGWMLREDYVNKTLRAADCGIFVPTNSQQPAKIFSIIGTDLSMEQIQQRNENIAALASTSAANGTYVKSVPSISGAQAGLGAGLGFAIVGVLADAENGRYVILRNQEDGQRLREIIENSALHSE